MYHNLRQGLVKAMRVSSHRLKPKLIKNQKSKIKNRKSKMAIIPRQQVIPFTVLPGSEVDLTFNTKYDHDKATGVVLLPDRNIHGDTVFLDINGENVLPRGFNAGLIAYRQFLNKEIKHNTYFFEEWAQGSDVRIIYKNNGSRTVNIDLLLFTVIGDKEPITKRKKLQIVPVPFLKKPMRTVEDLLLGYEICEVRTKTDYFFDELIGVFVDYYESRLLSGDENLFRGTLGKIIEEFLDFYRLTEEFQEDAAIVENAAKKLQEKLEDKEALTVIDADDEPVEDEKYTGYVKIMEDALVAFLADESNFISQKNLLALQDAVEDRFEYNDKHQSFSTFELTVGSVPMYPENYPIAKIAPRYRKSFNETMYRTEMQVQEADIFIRYEDLRLRYDHELSALTDAQGNLWNYYPIIEGEHMQYDFSVYFLYNQTVKNKN